MAVSSCKPTMSIQSHYFTIAVNMAFLISMLLRHPFMVVVKLLSKSLNTSKHLMPMPIQNCSSIATLEKTLTDQSHKSLGLDTLMCTAAAKSIKAEWLRWLTTFSISTMSKVS